MSASAVRLRLLEAGHDLGLPAPRQLLERRTSTFGGPGRRLSSSGMWLARKRRSWQMLLPHIGDFARRARSAASGTRSWRRGRRLVDRRGADAVDQPAAPCVPLFQASMPSSVASLWCTEHRALDARGRGSVTTTAISMMRSVGRQAGHLEVDPDQVLVAGQARVSRRSHGGSQGGFRRGPGRHSTAVPTPRPMPRHHPASPRCSSDRWPLRLAGDAPDAPCGAAPRRCRPLRGHHPAGRAPAAADYTLAKPASAAGPPPGAARADGLDAAGRPDR